MRSLVLSFLLMVMLGCNTVDPSECWVNTSGGAGGSGTTPIGAGVGATSGGDFAEPGKGPLAEPGSNPDNPCVKASTPNAKVGNCVVTWRGGSDTCKGQGAGEQDCTTRYQTSKKYSELDAVKDDCEHAFGVGNGSGAKDCTCGWLDPGVTPVATYWWTCKQRCLAVKGGATVNCTNEGQTWEEELQTNSTNYSAAESVWSGLFNKYLAKEFVRDTEFVDCYSSSKHPIFQPTGVEPAKGPKKTYLCSGDVPCERTDPNDGKTSGCTFDKQPVEATSPQGAVVEGGYLCAHTMVKKWTGGWTCYPDGLTCVPK